MIRVTYSGLRLDPSLLDECVKLMDWAMLMEGMDWAQFMNLTHSHQSAPAAFQKVVARRNHPADVMRVMSFLHVMNVSGPVSVLRDGSRPYMTRSCHDVIIMTYL